MGTLRIHLFGNFRFYRDLSSQEIRVIPNVQTLLARLVIQPGRLYSRDRIASLIWEEASEVQAHSCLNTALWRLRKILEPRGVPAGTYLISTPNGELGFNFTGDCWVDTIEFEKKIQHTIQIPSESVSMTDIKQLEQAVSIYQGDLLEDSYYDWILQERERLHITYMDALYYLLSFYQYHKEYNKAIRWGQQILLADPLREDVHRDLMRLFVENGQRALAVRQYQRCRQVLEAELSIEPMPETQMVYDQIVSRQRSKRSQMEGSVPLAETLESLHSAIDSVYRAQRDLQEVLARLNK